MHSSACGTTARIVFRSFSSTARFSSFTVARYSSIVVGFPAARGALRRLALFLVMPADLPPRPRAGLRGGSARSDLEQPGRQVLVPAVGQDGDDRGRALDLGREHARRPQRRAAAHPREDPLLDG